MNIAPAAAHAPYIERVRHILDEIPVQSQEQARIAIVAIRTLDAAQQSSDSCGVLSEKLKKIQGIIKELDTTDGAEIPTISGILCEKIQGWQGIVDHPLSTKLVADYIELVHGYLDSLPFTSQEEARAIAQALRSPMDAFALQALSPDLRKRVEEVHSLIQDPSLYAQPEYHAQFKGIVQARIAATVVRLEATTPQEVQALQERRREQGERQGLFFERALNAVAPAPGSAAHVVSEEENLLFQAAFLERLDVGGRVREGLVQHLVRNPSLVSALPEGIYLSDEEIKQVLSRNGLALQFFDDSLRDTPEFVVVAVQSSGEALQFAGPICGNNFVIVVRAVQQNPHSLVYASEALQDNRDIVLEAVLRSSVSFRYASGALQSDRGFVLCLVRQNELVLLSLREDFKNDREIVRLALSRDVSLLRFAGEEVQNDRTFVLELVRRNGLALANLRETFKKDREIVLAAVRQNPRAFAFADESLKRSLMMRLRVVVLRCVRAIFG